MTFAEVSVGQNFKFNNIVYTKTEPQKVSCCKTLNAVNLENNQKVMIKPNDVVELVTE